MKRTLFIGLLVALAVLGVVALRSGGETYTVKMDLADAGGLRNGSPVVVGGVQIGTVALDANFKNVSVKLEIDKQYAPVGKDARASIIAQNVLGQKQVLLTVGDTANKPAPDGYVLPAPQTSAATDIDQLLSTLDPDTRTRLAVLINETGTAFAGREMDFKTFLTDIAPALSDGSNLLGQLTQDNRVLGHLVDLSDSYVGSLTASRAELSHAIDEFGQTTETVAARRAELRETLRRAPAALIAARGFLGELEQTTGPLDATANLLRATAPSVVQTFDRLAPFTAAAKPTLAAATRYSAPALVALGTISTPKAANLLPTLDDARRLVQADLPPVGSTLNRSVDNILATVQNWSRAIQFRDGLGHIFRGEASFSPAAYSAIVRNLGGGTARSTSPARTGGKPSRPATQTQGAPQTAAPAPQDSKLPVVAPAVQALQNLLKGLPDTAKAKAQLEKVVGDLTGKPLLPGTQPLLGQDNAKNAQSLLDFLLRP